MDILAKAIVDHPVEAILCVAFAIFAIRWAWEEGS